MITPTLNENKIEKIRMYKSLYISMTNGGGQGNMTGIYIILHLSREITRA